MRTVVILTGQLRTIRKTMRFLKRNVVTGHQDVFACLQNDTQESEESWETWLREEIPTFKRIIWFSNERCPEWIPIRTRLVEAMAISNLWKDYLKTSGSMIEYYQLYLAYHAMEHYEQRHGRYDQLVRMRTDSIFCKMIDFHWLDWTVSDIASRWNEITKRLEQPVKSAVTHSQVFHTFMGTLLSDDLLTNLPSLLLRTLPHEGAVIPNTMEEVYEYLHRGRYLIGVRTNNLYVVRRDLFHLIPALGTMYGLFRGPHEDPYWFNAENQFVNACYHSNLTVHTYSTVLEEHSLAYPSQWREEDFFVEGEPRYPEMLYCVVRR
jgi:hypothetical protein